MRLNPRQLSVDSGISETRLEQLGSENFAGIYVTELSNLAQALNTNMGELLEMPRVEQIALAKAHDPFRFCFDQMRHARDTIEWRRKIDLLKVKQCRAQQINLAVEHNAIFERMDDQGFLQTDQ